jgi:transaldolase/glucose-6-phosphate isomerase
MNPLKALNDFGQAVWIDFLSRDFVADGTLARLVKNDGLSGLTSNPAIFAAAITAGGSYQKALHALVAELGDQVEPVALYERLAIADIQAAADVLEQVYRATDGRDGFVSLEVSPTLAHDTDGTIAEARTLWKRVRRPNLMIKVPGTAAGLPAIRTLLGEGINVNITLLFSQSMYEKVVDAYFDGVEQFARTGGDASRLASVASFFVSRIDVAIDAAIEKRLGALPAAERDELNALRGKVAIANAKLAYQLYKRRFAEPRWIALRGRGARPQRLLWASTSTKNPAYRDVLYAEELIGPDTVDTMPPATIEAFRDHGRPRASLEEGIGEAERVMSTLERRGVSIDAVTDRLANDGIDLFVDAANKLLAAVAKSRPPATTQRRASGKR